MLVSLILSILLSAHASESLILKDSLKAFKQSESLSDLDTNLHPVHVLKQLAATSEDTLCQNLSELNLSDLALISPYLDTYRSFTCTTNFIRKAERQIGINNLGFSMTYYQQELFSHYPKEDQPLLASKINKIFPIRSEVQEPFFTGINYVNTESGEVVYQQDLIDGGFSNIGLEKGEIILTFDDGPHPRRTDELLEILTKHNYDSSFFRFPYGARNKSLAKEIKLNRISSFFWNMDSRDWAISNPTTLYNYVVEEINREQGGIILFHEIHSQTIAIMDVLLKNLKLAGYTIRIAQPNYWKEEI